MPKKEKQNKTFTYLQLAELLVKESGIHEGHWGLFFRFGLGGGNLPIGGPGGQVAVRPAAIVPVTEIGIQEFGDPNPLTVDAAKVNPKPRSGSSRRKKKT